MTATRELMLQLVPTPNARVWRLPTLGLVVACPVEVRGGKIGFEVSVILDGVVSAELRSEALNAVKVALRDLDVTQLILRSVATVDTVEPD